MGIFITSLREKEFLENPFLSRRDNRFVGKGQIKYL